MRAILATLLTCACTGIASANITITGTGKIVYVPDIGYVTVGVSSDGVTAAEAWQKNSTIVKRIFDVLKAQGIDPKDMKTSGLSVTPRYVHPKDKEPQLVGYTVTYDLAVTVRKLDELGKVLDEMVENGANRNVGISFGSSEAEKLLDQARARAVAEARRRAELYVTGAGGQLGQLVSITEGSHSPWPMYRYELASKAGNDATLPIAAGQQEVSVSVTVEYTIVQKLAPAA
jgi:uncharacterized protein YggE